MRLHQHGEIHQVPRTAFAPEQPCTLVSYHAPQPVMTEFHHSKPIFLQKRLWGEVRFGPDTWLCSSCHDAVHAWIYWLLGEWGKPPYMGRAAKAEAERTFGWYLAERESMSQG